MFYWVLLMANPTIDLKYSMVNTNPCSVILGWFIVGLTTFCGTTLVPKVCRIMRKQYSNSYFSKITCPKQIVSFITFMICFIYTHINLGAV